MEYKKVDAPSTTVTRNPDRIGDITGNLYEAIAITAKRANQVGAEMKEELYGKLEEFAAHTDTLEEIFENREQIEISRFYERLPKPVAIALEQLKHDEVFWRYAEKRYAESKGKK